MSVSSTSPIIKRLQAVFGVSVILLLISSYSSYFSIQKLIDSSKLVNHTYDVILQSEKVQNIVKDAVSAERAYIITHDPVFLGPYQNSYTDVLVSITELRRLTGDNPRQQDNIGAVRQWVDERYKQMHTVLRVDSSGVADGAIASENERNAEIVRGKEVMDKLYAALQVVQNEERRLLAERTSEQAKFTLYTPIFILVAAFLSILITISAYVRIKADLDERLAKQLADEEKYLETSKRIANMQDVTLKIAGGDYTARSYDSEEDEIGLISAALNDMGAALERNFNEIKRKDWLQTGLVNVNESLRGRLTVNSVAENVLTGLITYTTSIVGTFYVAEADYLLKLAGSYGISGATENIELGEGLLGQAAKDQKVVLVNNVPAKYLPVASSLGTTGSISLIMLPLVYAGKLVGAIELGYLQHPKPEEITFLETVQETIAIGINTAVNFGKIQELLERTQVQTEELQSQHSELENINTELESQSQKLQASEEELKVQQEELVQTNHELQQRSRQLEDRNVEVNERNQEIQKKAEELALTTKYKSEFLANMSHELRTPLNSILLLSRLISENNESNLTSEQVEYAQVIQASGNGLLSLIDEILDLSKIEAGKMSLEISKTSIESVINDLKPLFAPVAAQKNLEFKIEVAASVAPYFDTDKFRLEQILKNLLSNAIKFTQVGSVTLRIDNCNPRHKGLICFKVIDTGIGIAAEKKGLVFEAFQQADGSTKRKFGGTGLGLSISRELAKLLGGEILLESEPEKGSVFTLVVPMSKNAADVTGISNVIEIPAAVPEKKADEPQRYISDTIPAQVPDDRDTIAKGDKVILIVEDDTAFAKALLDYARNEKYKAVVAVSGDEGLRLAELYNPVGILLDIQLPVKDGWQVMDELKNSAKTRHIPVHIMSSYEVKRESLMKGAIDFINKPMAFEQMQAVFSKIEHILSKDEKKVLIVEENPQHAKALSYFLQNFNITPEIKSTVSESVNALTGNGADCVILDMGIPDMNAYQMLEEIKKNPGLESLPIIVFTGKSFSKSEEQKLKSYADSIVVKTAHSYQRILDEVSLFLHLVARDKQINKYENNGTLEEVLRDKEILLVDDDVRNIYSVSKALERYKMKIITATDGKEALQAIKENPGIKMVLMDIMMPEMDGFEAMRNIRKIKKYARLPIIAVTAKAMMGDREKCIEAGASDYISKPIDIDQLLSLLRVWLYEKK